MSLIRGSALVSGLSQLSAGIMTHLICLVYSLSVFRDRMGYHVSLFRGADILLKACSRGEFCSIYEEC